MKEQFISKRFNEKSRALLSKIVTIVEQYAADDYDLSLRQLFYLLAGVGAIEKKQEAYKNLGNLVSDARLAGLIDWNMIRDRGRIPFVPGRCESIPDIINNVKNHFKVDMWARQSSHVEVFVEKQSLENVLEPLCWELDIPFSSNKGYSSSSAYYDASKRYLEAAEAGKKLHMIYLGDHDPSGVDMSRDIDDRLTLFLESALTGAIFLDSKLKEELAMVDPRPHKIHRVALNMDQVRAMHLQSSPAKAKDTRIEDYRTQFGTYDTWELAAVEPRTMVKLVRDAVEGLIDQEKWNEDKAREEAGRAELQHFAYTYGQIPEVITEIPPEPYDVQQFTREERQNE